MTELHEKVVPSRWFFRLIMVPAAAFDGVDKEITLASAVGTFHLLLDDLRLEFDAPPDFFPALRHAWLGLISFANALAFYNDKKIDFEVVDWVELKPDKPLYPIFGKIQKLESENWKVENVLFSSALEAVDLCNKYHVLRFVLEDYQRSLAADRVDSLIYLYRAVEEIKVFLGSWENITSKLNIPKNRWDKHFKVIANKFRHSKLANKPFQVSGKDQAFAENIGRGIIQSFINYLGSLR